MNCLKRSFRLFSAVTLLLAGFLPVVASGVQEQAGFIAAGTPSATPYYIQNSDVAGPVVFIVGGIHGNEPAGAYAADQIRLWPIKRGRLIVVPRANMLALAADKRNTPAVDSLQANLNRNFPKAGERKETIGFMAQALWAFLEKQKPGWLIDLHEGSDFDQVSDKSVGSSIITFPTPAGKEVSAEMLSAINDTISDPDRKFTQRGSPIDGSLARAAGEHLSANAMILETTRKDQPLSLRVRQHLIMVDALLKRLEMIDVKFKIK